MHFGGCVHPTHHKHGRSLQFTAILFISPCLLLLLCWLLTYFRPIEHVFTHRILRVTTGIFNPVLRGPQSSRVLWPTRGQLLTPGTSTENLLGYGPRRTGLKHPALQRPLLKGLKAFLCTQPHLQQVKTVSARSKADGGASFVWVVQKCRQPSHGRPPQSGSRCFKVGEPRQLEWHR